MAHQKDDVLRNINQHGGYESSPKQIDMGLLHVARDGTDLFSNEVLAGNLENSFVQTTTTTTERTLLPQRKRISYRLRRLKAGRELFMLPNHVERILDPGLFLYGQIKACPSSKNQYRFTLEWDLSKSSTALPNGFDQNWLRHSIGVEGKPLLQQAMACYDAEDMETNKSKNLSLLSPCLPPRGTHPAGPVNTTTTTTPGHSNQRDHSAASLRTSSTVHSNSSGSTTRTNSSRRRGISTRRSVWDSIESDSDEDSSSFLLLAEEDSTSMTRIPPVSLPGDKEQEMHQQEEEDKDDKDAYFEDEEEQGDDTNHNGALGNLLNNLEWKFKTVDKDDVLHVEQPSYSGPSGLQQGITFTDPLQCFFTAGGFNHDLVKKFTMSSNNYFKMKILPHIMNRRLHGHRWEDITTEEMFHFMGILLKIGLIPIDYGGYPTYWSVKNHQLHMDNGVSIELEGTQGWAYHVMPLWRFKQIRSAFHPADASEGLGGDKCYMLRQTLNNLNVSAANTFIVGPTMTFDEGRQGNRSRFNPVRVYNASKPNKFAVEFFILCDANDYFIVHIDVYQGKQTTDLYIDDRARGLPTTQKAVMNAIFRSNLHYCPQGRRVLAADNRYACPELAVLLDKFGIDLCGTCRPKRKGFPYKDMALKKTDGRGKYIMMYDSTHRVLATQWVDSKVVYSITTRPNTKVSTVRRQRGSTQLEIDCPDNIQEYQRSMYGVDKHDQLRAVGGGFAKKAHFKKWYKKTLLGVFDMMLVNSYIAWNMSLQTRKLTRHEFFHCVAQQLIEYKDESLSSAIPPSPEKESAFDNMKNGHQPEGTLPFSKCAVCNLEVNILKKDMVNKERYKDIKRYKGYGLSRCRLCGIIAHNHMPQQRDNTSTTSYYGTKIREVEPQFEDMTCYQIAHSNIGYDLWKRLVDNKNNNSISNQKMSANKTRSFRVNERHYLYRNLCKVHGVAEGRSRKRNRQEEEEKEPPNSEEGD